MITLLIPTMNRSDFLKRLLNYFADTYCKYQIRIGDSSDFHYIDETKKTVRELECKLNINYYQHSGLNLSKSIKQLIQKVSTPYASIIADDDFLVPKSLERCIDFLELNPAYIACHGIGAVFRLRRSGPYGQFDNIWEYQLPSREEETASKRFLNHLSEYSNNLFSVYRTPILKRMFENDAVPDKSLENDLLPSCIAAILGKCKKLDCFHIIHQIHEQQGFVDHYDWITSQNWFPSYQIFYNTLSEELRKQDNISIDKARAVVKQAFWIHLKYKSNSHFRNCYGTSGNTFSIKQKIGRIFGIKKMWNVVKNIQYKIHPSKHITLPVLLNPFSPYHVDFIPIYRAITNAQQEG